MENNLFPLFSYTSSQKNVVINNQRSSCKFLSIICIFRLDNNISTGNFPNLIFQNHLINVFKESKLIEST